METLDIITWICLTVALLVLCSCDRTLKGGDSLIVTLTVIVAAYWTLVIWLFAIKFLLACIAFLFFTYFGLCVGDKKFLRGKLYIVVFVTTSVLFIASVCMVFGSYHILSEYKDLPGQPGLKYLLFKHEWSHTDLTRTLALLLTGFKHFFVSIDDVGLKDVHLLQRVVGIMLTGSVVGWNIAAIKPFLVQEDHRTR